MAHLENPPPKTTGVLLDGVRLARLHPMEWVYVKTYTSKEAASVSASRMKKKPREGGWYETRTNGAKLYIRFIGVETK